MKTNRIIGMLFCALTLAACNDVSHEVSRAPNADDQATGGSKTMVASSQESQQSSSTLPEAVPVPPASSSPIVSGQAQEPMTSTETPVTMANAAASTTEPTMPETSGSTSAASEASTASSGAPGTDSAATQPLSTLNTEEQSKSMPMALHGNNHSSPSVEQRATN